MKQTYVAKKFYFLLKSIYLTLLDMFVYIEHHSTDSKFTRKRLKLLIM